MSLDGDPLPPAPDAPAPGSEYTVGFTGPLPSGLGLTLQVAGGNSLVVYGFTRHRSGSRLPAEDVGCIHEGDVLVGLNSVRLDNVRKGGPCVGRRPWACRGCAPLAPRRCSSGRPPTALQDYALSSESRNSPPPPPPSFAGLWPPVAH